VTRPAGRNRAIKRLDNRLETNFKTTATPNLAGPISAIRYQIIRNEFKNTPAAAAMPLRGMLPLMQGCGGFLA
jgi:hypothetical protein